MISCLSFVGTLPSYIVESIHQLRTFSSDIIYLIISDIYSPYIECIKKYDIIIIDYNEVIDNDFLETVKTNLHKFEIVNTLKGREEIFIRCFERFFLLKNLLNKNNLSDCLFLELDNLIYDDPNNWLNQFSSNELCYMYDNENRFSSGLMYVKNAKALENFLKLMIDFISNTNEFLTEMTTLSMYYELNKTAIEILPTYWPSSEIPNIAYSNFYKYNSLFDAAAIGVYLLGIDPHHTNGVIEIHKKSAWSAIDYTNLQFEWKTDELGRKRPYVWNGEQWLLINNLHIHSKDLKSGLSVNME
jgi:hypothetical protein